MSDLGIKLNDLCKIDETLRYYGEKTYSDLEDSVEFLTEEVKRLKKVKVNLTKDRTDLNLRVKSINKENAELKARVKYLENTIDRFPEEGEALLAGYHKCKKDKETSNDEY